MKKFLYVVLLLSMMFSFSVLGQDSMICDGDVCYFPTDTGIVQPLSVDTYPLTNYREISREVGYMTPSEFVDFLAPSLDSAVHSNPTLYDFSNQSFFWIILLILVGGVALNLTPCILPMIPINLMIITGMNMEERYQHRLRGAFLGFVYALGITLAYGSLGLLALLGGVRMGTLNSSPYFYFAIAIIFVILGLAMMDKFGFSLDFSRYSARFASLRGGKMIPVFFLGAIAALLAGACIAPVLVGVLAFSLERWIQNDVFALGYPFLLGFGMGLPWIFLGAGVSFLPKTGAWMNKVKVIFASLIILTGAYYIYEGATLIKSRAEIQATSQDSGTYQSIASALELAEKTKKIPLLYFTAEWCHNCTEMKKKTFPDAKVDVLLKEKFQLITIDGDRSENERILQQFKVQGFPTFIQVQR